METEKRIEQDIKELQAFLNKKTNDIPFYLGELKKNIELINDEKMKAQLSKLMDYAMKGDSKNVEAIAEILKNSYTNKK